MVEVDVLCPVQGLLSLVLSLSKVSLVFISFDINFDESQQLAKHSLIL